MGVPLSPSSGVRVPCPGTGPALPHGANQSGQALRELAPGGGRPWLRAHSAQNGRQRRLCPLAVGWHPRLSVIARRWPSQPPWATGAHSVASYGANRTSSVALSTVARKAARSAIRSAAWRDAPSGGTPPCALARRGWNEGVRSGGTMRHAPRGTVRWPGTCGSGRRPRPVRTAWHSFSSHAVGYVLFTVHKLCEQLRELVGADPGTLRSRRSGVGGEPEAATSTGMRNLNAIG